MNNGSFDFQPVVFGSDLSSYTLARSIHAHYGMKPLLLCSSILYPCLHSEIVEIVHVPHLTEDADILRSALETLHAERSSHLPWIGFVPSELYLRQLQAVQPTLSFSLHLPYPSAALTEQVTVKEKFYDLLDSWGMPSPKTQVVGPSDYKSLHIEGPLFLKASDYDEFMESDLDDWQKGYYAATRKEALSTLEKIYASNFRGSMIAQSYIEGGDGTEYVLCGYRAQDGTVVQRLALCLLLDRRPRWIGNYFVLCDAQNAALEQQAAEIVQRLDYHGFYNFDIKVDSRTHVPYFFELNPRLGRSFYFTELSGLSFPVLAIEDWFGHPLPPIAKAKPFLWLSLDEEIARAQLQPSLRPLFDDDTRQKNKSDGLDYAADCSEARKMTIQQYYAFRKDRLLESLTSTTNEDRTLQ